MYLETLSNMDEARKLYVKLDLNLSLLRKIQDTEGYNTFYGKKVMTNFKNKKAAKTCLLL